MIDDGTTKSQENHQRKKGDRGVGKKSGRKAEASGENQTRKAHRFRLDKNRVKGLGQEGKETVKRKRTRGPPPP